MNQVAREIIEWLVAQNRSLVLAESCTAGLIASTLTDIAGSSAAIAGSFVVYQNESKIDWLGVDPNTIQTETAVSQMVAEQMVRGALARTAHADIAAAITGHLGPNAPPHQDGVVFIAVGDRDRIDVERVQLKSQQRRERKREAAADLLGRLKRSIAS